MAQAAAPTGAGAGMRKPDNLALVFQELLTVIERMRSNRQPVTDAVQFRHQVMEALKLADQEGRRRGYTAEDIKLAIYAVVAFLDETILKLRQPVFAGWTRQPLQLELFQTQIAGEIFFQNLQILLGRNDSQELADLLEVYQLCMLLGFNGRYELGGRGELKSVIDATAQKIRRIRGTGPGLSPSWMLPKENLQFASVDVWVKRLMIGSGALVGLTLLLFAIYKLTLSSGISTLTNLAGGAR